jgi:hypothetical protein
MLDVIDQILAETALFAVVMRGDKWVGTTLIRRSVSTDIPQLGPKLLTSFLGLETTTKRLNQARKHEPSAWEVR